MTLGNSEQLLQETGDDDDYDDDAATSKDSCAMQRQPRLLTVSVLRHGLLHYIIEESMAKALYFLI